jgi:putative PEP-CTERM system TPR-repeat lipoprotein
MALKIKRSNLTLFALIVTGALATVGCARSPEAKEARFMSRGKDALKRKDYGRASLEFLNAIQVMPRDVEAYYQLGIAFLATGDLPRGASALRKATELNPKHVDAQLRLSSLMAASRDLNAVKVAQQRLSDILALAPDNGDVLDVLALTKFRLGKREEAEEGLQQALDKFPAQLQSSLVLAKLKLVRRDFAGAQQVLQNAVTANPQSAEAALALGRFYLLSGKTEQGQAEVRRALQIDSNNGPALQTLAELQFNSGHPDEAERTFQQLSQLKDENYRPLHAAFLLKTGKLGAAIAEFEKLAKEAPDDRAARTRLVAAYVAAGKTADAERTLTASLEKNPNDTDALLQRSQMSVVSGRYTEAEHDLQNLLHFRPDSAEAHYILSKVYGAGGASLNQRQELAEALRLNPNLLAARVELAQRLIASNAASAALKVMNETPEAQRKKVAVIAARNWALLGVGDNAAARQGVDAGLALAREPELLLEDGALKLVAKDPAGARASLEEALKMLPDSVPGWEFLRQASAAQKQSRNAVEMLQQVALKQPQSSKLSLLLGRWLMDEHKLAEARTAFEAAKKADPKSAAADIALAQLEMMQGRMDPARRRLAEVLAAQPRNVTARLLLGEIAKKTGDRTGAIAQYRAVLEVDHDSVVALNDLAYILAKDSPDEALKYAQKAGELAPNNPEVQDTLGWVYYRKGIYRSAIGYLKTAMDKEGTPPHKYHLGLAYLKAGNQNLGQKMVDAALEADPTLATTQGR